MQYFMHNAGGKENAGLDLNAILLKQCHTSLFQNTNSLLKEIGIMSSISVSN